MPDIPNQTPSHRPKKTWKDLLRLAGVAGFFVAVGFLLNNDAVRAQLFDIDRLRGELQNQGLRGNAKFFGTAAVATALGIPRLWICAIAGSLYGAAHGTAIGFFSTLTGACVDFLVGRSLLRGPIKRNMPDRLRRWYKALNKNGFRAILYLRLFPGANATLTSLIGGASRMRFRDYLLATALGFVPFTVVFATLGSSAAKQNHWQLAGGLLLFLAVAAGQWMFSRARRRSDYSLEKDEAPGPQPGTYGKADV